MYVCCNITEYSAQERELFHDFQEHNFVTWRWNDLDHDLQNRAMKSDGSCALQYVIFSIMHTEFEDNQIADDKVKLRMPKTFMPISITYMLHYCFPITALCKRFLSRPTTAVGRAYLGTIGGSCFLLSFFK